MVASRGFARWHGEAPGRWVDHHDRTGHNQELLGVVLPCRIDLSRSTLNYVAGLIRSHRKKIASAWRLLAPGQQALLVLVHLRKGETFAEAGAGFGVSTTTAWRYVEETVVLLSARSPRLTAALRKAGRDGVLYLVLDGTLIHIDRVADPDGNAFCVVDLSRAPSDSA